MGRQLIFEHLDFFTGKFNLLQRINRNVSLKMKIRTKSFINNCPSSVGKSVNLLLQKERICNIDWTIPVNGYFQYPESSVGFTSLSFIK